MKIYEDKENLGNFANLTLSLDFPNILKYRGERGKRTQLEKNLGKMLLALSIIFFLACLALQILNGNLTIQNILFPKDIQSLLLYVPIPFVLYSFYLNRNKEKFDLSLNSLDFFDVNKLIKKNKASEIEIDKLFTVKMLNAIDYFYFHHNETFLLNLVSYVIHQPFSIY